MTDREKLIELMEQVYFCSMEALADHLIANGVVVREKGEWEKRSGLHSCSVCGKVCPYDVQADVIEYWTSNFCPNCGADMRKVESNG